MAAPNTRRQRMARDKLNELFAHPSTVLIVHYACQSFYRAEADGSPRVASIAVRNLAGGDTEAFSIHQELELAHIPHAHAPHVLDHLERQMLNRFFRYLAENKNMRFVHWNMRDVKFGFQALEHRYRVLGGDPYVLHDNQKIDLALLLGSIYGSNYCRPPVFETLARRNKLALSGFVAGADEPRLFAKGEYAAVLKSNLCKIALITDIVTLAHDAKLKTDANWWTLNEGRLREAYEFFVDNPAYGVAMAVLTGFGAVLKLLEHLGL